MERESDSSLFEPWRIQLYGGFKAERRRNQAVFRTKKTASLLAYLSYYAGKPISKELLVEALWPESESGKGRQSLRMAVSSIRASLGAPDWNPEDHVRSDRDVLEASSDGICTDVGEFRHSFQAAAASEGSSKSDNLKRAIGLYSGPFLAGFADEWILPQALELEEAFAQAVCGLVLLNSEIGDLSQAVAVGRSALGIHPNREDLHVALMRAYAFAGERASAVKQFEELERMLDETWGEQPGEEASQLLESLPRHAAVSVANSEIPALKAELPFRDTMPFFGREREREELNQLLQLRPEYPRLVTLFGLGGSGKTRLARRLMEELHERFGGRTWFVSLVGTEDEAQLAEAILTDIVKDKPSDVDALDAVARGIGTQPSLLILDNVEQLIPPVRRAIGHLLASCAGLRILATSRILMDAEGERAYAVAPLPLPAELSDITALRASPSVQLLMEAAQKARPGFAVTPANAPSVLALCRRLEGLPLAIELAAAKLATLTPAQVVASIGRRVDLSTMRTDVSPRHRSLQTVIEWSLGLLEVEEREAFARLSVCRGGFSSALAGMLLGERAEAHLQRLCRCSLISWTETEDELRFEMLETVREIAARQLDRDPSLSQEAIELHCSFVRRICAVQEVLFDEEQFSRWIKGLNTETSNILAAIESGVKGRIPAEEAWEMALPLRHLIERRGRPQIWVEPLDQLLDATVSCISPATAAKAHSLLGRAYYGLRNIDATYDHCKLAIDAADRADVNQLRIECRIDLATPAMLRGQFDEAREALESALGLVDQVEDPSAAARAYTNLGWVFFDRGQEQESESVFIEALACAEQSQDSAVIAAALTGLGCAVGQTRYDEARQIFGRAVGLRQSTGSPERIAHCLYYRGLVDYRNDALDLALANLTKSMETFVCNGIALGQTPLTICGNLLARLERFEDAMAFWCRSEKARKRYGMLMLPTIQRDFDREFGRVQQAMGIKDLESATFRFASSADESLLERIGGRTK